MRKFLLIAAVAASTTLATTMPGAVAGEPGKPIVIAHRGASGYRPEHTLMAYKVGIEQGADYVEPDLVMTKDGHLVARHDVYLSGTTDVADHPEFADRKRTLDGKRDWYVFDFTLAELKTLKARQPWPSRGDAFDGMETIATIDEIIDFVADARGDRPVGLYIEMKRPALFADLGLDPTKALLAAFNKIGAAGMPAYFQCFNGDYLVEFGKQADVPLIWLIEGRHNAATEAYELDVPLDKYGNAIAGVGLNKALLVDGAGRPTDVIGKAHSLGLKVHLWTVRNDHVAPMFDHVRAELKTLWSFGADGIFADFPDTAVQSRDSFMLMREPDVE
jgi:glycerophosphoryl diester phosphodiesterase